MSSPEVDQQGTGARESGPDTVERQEQQARDRRAADQARIRQRLLQRDSGIPQVGRGTGGTGGDGQESDVRDQEWDQDQDQTTPAAPDPAPRMRTARRPRAGAVLEQAAAAAPGAPAQAMIPRTGDERLDPGTGQDIAEPDPSDAELSELSARQRREAIRQDPMRMADALFEQVDPPGTPPVTVKNPPDPADTPGVLAETRRRAEAVKKGRRKAVKDAMRDPAMRQAGPEQRADRIMQIQDHHSQLMVLNCVKPLTQNVGPRELVESATALAVLWALSPRVQDLVRGQREKINEALRVYRKDELARNERTDLGASKEEMDRAEARARRQDQNLLKNTEATLAEGHEVFGLEDAAEHLLAMDEALYENIRDGADYTEALQEHNETIDVLLGVWQKQGLSATEIKTEVWKRIGQEAATDSAVASRYWHTFRGDLRPSLRATDGSWDGRWVMPDGKGLDPAGSSLFVVRMPLNPDQHLVQMASLVATDLEIAAAKSPESVKETLLGHTKAWDLRDLHVTGTRPGTLSSRSVRFGDALAAVGRAHAGIMAMTDDGIHPDLRQAVVSGAVQRAWSDFAESNPEAARAYADKYPDGLTEVDLEAFDERARRVAEPAVRGPVLDSDKIDNPALLQWEEIKRGEGATLPEPVWEMNRHPAEPDSVPEELEAIGPGVDGQEGEGHENDPATAVAPVIVRPEPHSSRRPSREEMLARSKESADPQEDAEKVSVPRADVSLRDPELAVKRIQGKGPQIPRRSSAPAGARSVSSSPATSDTDRGGNTGFGHQQLIWAPMGPDGRPQPGLGGQTRPRPADVPGPVPERIGADADPTTPEIEKKGESSSRNRQLRTIRGDRINPDKADRWDGPEL